MHWPVFVSYHLVHKCYILNFVCCLFVCKILESNRSVYMLRRMLKLTAVFGEVAKEKSILFVSSFIHVRVTRMRIVSMPTFCAQFRWTAYDYILFDCSPVHFILQSRCFSIASIGSIMGGSSANTEGQARSLARCSSIRAVTFDCRGLQRCYPFIRFDAVTSLDSQPLLNRYVYDNSSLINEGVGRSTGRSSFCGRKEIRDVVAVCQWVEENLLPSIASSPLIWLVGSSAGGPVAGECPNEIAARRWFIPALTPNFPIFKVSISQVCMMNSTP